MAKKIAAGDGQGRNAPMTAAPGHERESLLSLQVLRALAALGVTLDHIVGYEFTRQYGLPDALPRFSIGAAGVDLFFVISGFVMVYSSERFYRRPRAPQEFFLRRLARIVPLYWTTTSIILVYLLIQYRDLARANFTLESVAASYLFIPWPQIDGYMAPVHGVGWTLNYEMFFYACFCFALLFSRRTGVVLLSVALLAFVGVNRLWPMPLPVGYWAAPVILEFVFGMLIALGLRAGLRAPSPLAAGIVVLGILALAATHHWGMGNLSRVVAWGVPCAAIVGALALAESTAKPGPVWRTLSLLGDASYSLYLLHPLAITLPRRLFPHFVNPATSPWLYAALLVAMAVTAAVFCHLLFERPITRLLQRRIASAFHSERGAAAVADLQPRADQRADVRT
jgi:exopolysaccharide production protein ExoZ